MIVLPTHTVVGPCVHTGAAFDVFQLEVDGRRLAFKTGRNAARCEVFTAEAILGGVSTVWDLDLRLGCRSGSISSSCEEYLLSEHARVTLSDGQWNHRTLGLAFCDIPNRGHCLGLVSEWVDGASLGSVPIAEQRRLVVGMLPSLWDALKAAGHGDVHPSNMVVAPNRKRFSLIDPAAMVWNQRGESGCSIGASWVSFTTHGSSYPLLPPYSPVSVVDGASLRDYVDGFLSAVGGNFHETPVGLQTILRVVNNKPLLTPPNPVGSPLAADWYAVGVLYYMTLTGSIPFGNAWPAWLNVSTMGLFNVITLFKRALTPFPRPSDLNHEVTPAEDELALGLLRLSVNTRDRVVEGCARVADALKSR